MPKLLKAGLSVSLEGAVCPGCAVKVLSDSSPPLASFALHLFHNYAKYRVTVIQMQSNMLHISSDMIIWLVMIAVKQWESKGKVVYFLSFGQWFLPLNSILFNLISNNNYF